MGFNLGAKAAAAGLYALAEGDTDKAKRMWRIIANYDPWGPEEAIDIVDTAYKRVMLGEEPETQAKESDAES